MQDIDDKAYRSYVLSRVLQGAHEIGDRDTEREATAMLYDCQDLDRPFGRGLVGDNIKGSLNALEALWPTLSAEDIGKVGAMVDALARAHSRENTVGILVAIPEEFAAIRGVFKADGAREESGGDATRATFSQPGYWAVVRLGKSHIDSEDATRKLLSDDNAKWLFMVGVAGSLGTKGDPDSHSEVACPQIGDVVLATSLAPHNIREKARAFAVESAPVPFRGGEWTTIPTSPSLFSSASKAAAGKSNESSAFAVHEGMIITGHLTDSPESKAAILKKWPGALAIEEEGYIFALLCLHDERPYMVVRGIMDFAGGHKKDEARGGSEETRKKTAAKNAAEVAVAAIKILSNRW